MSDIYRKRRLLSLAVLLLAIITSIIFSQSSPAPPEETVAGETASSGALASVSLENLAIKGRAPKTDYSREQFGDGWTSAMGCDTRNIILHRDLANTTVDSDCNVTSGILNDPYTGKIIEFKRGSGTSDDVQIDHVVALSDAWQTGAQRLTRDKRIELANNPLELLAVDGAANQQKFDGDAATWLPSNKAFRCQYVARQIAVKLKYGLWITKTEHDAISSILSGCPDQRLLGQ